MRAGPEARPMTSVSGAGYQSKKQGAFDPLNQGHGPAPALAEKADNGPEYLAKEMERQVRFHSRHQNNYLYQIQGKEQTVGRPPRDDKHGDSYVPSCFGLRAPFCLFRPVCPFCFVLEVHVMMEESAAACVSGKSAEALEKGKEAVSQAYCCAVA